MTLSLASCHRMFHRARICTLHGGKESIVFLAYRKSLNKPTVRTLSHLKKQHYLIRDEVFSLLHLKTFHESEWKKSFQTIKSNEHDETVDVNKIIKAWHRESPDHFTPEKQQLIKEILLTHPSANNSSHTIVPQQLSNSQLTYDQYKANMLKYAEALDPRVWTLGLSYLCTGLSVGIIIPCMPLLISELQIPSTSFGTIISVFGLSKILGNIPAAHFVDKFGRKPTMITGIVLCGLTNSAVSLVLYPGFGIPWMIFCRFVAGFGVAGFMAGGQMILSDIATPLNRTRTFAPVMAGFSAGTALGPAVGGILLELIGLPNTYLTVGGIFGLVGAMIYVTIAETKPILSLPINAAAATAAGAVHTTATLPEHAAITVTPSSDVGMNAVLGSFRIAYDSWRSILQHSSIRSLVTINGVYWFVYSGAQMTLLPLHMVHESLHLTSAEIGTCFAFTSIISLLSTNAFASIADQHGKYKVIALGTALLSTSIYAIPFAESFEQLLCCLTPMALGVTALSASPVALMAELCKKYEEKPEQGLSLYRTAGDVGLLFGAVSAGTMANMFSIGSAFHVDGLIMTTAMIWFARKHWKNIYAHSPQQQQKKNT